MRLLLVEDDPELGPALAEGLRGEGFAVGLAEDGTRGLRAARSGTYDLAVLDLVLPGRSGFSVLEELRKAGSRLPVVILSGRSGLDDRLKAFRLGGDDYLAKPFSFEELLERVRAVLRRTAGAAEDRLTWKDLVVDLDAKRVTWKEVPIALTPREFALLEALLLARGKVLTREVLTQRFCAEGFDARSNVWDVHVTHLRSKLVRTTGLPIVETARGIGFRIPMPAH